MTVQLQFGTLIDEMKTFDTTNGWDVVVSYDERKVNSLLKTAKGHGPTRFPEMVVPDFNPSTGEIVQVRYRLTVSNPTLHFTPDSGSGKVRLVYDLSGDFGPMPTPVPPNTTMTLDVGLANLEGTITNEDESHFKPNQDQLHPQTGEQYKQAPNYIVKTGENVTHGICLVFRDTNVKVANPSTDLTVQAIINTIDRNVAKATADHLNKSTYYYFITGVDAPQSQVRTSTVVTLQPKSFCFTMLGGDAQLGLSGTLAMWISVEGGDDNGDAEPKFHPDSRNVNTIPRGNTASIIFSHNLIAREFIKKALEDRFDDVEPLSRKGEEGMKFSGKMRNRRIYIPTRNDKTENAVGFVKDYFQGVDFSPDVPKTTFQIPSKISTSDPKPTPITVSYKSDVKKVDWTRSRFNGEHYTNKSGVVNLEFIFNGVGWWEGGDRNELHLKFRRENDIRVDASAEKPPWWAPAGSGQLPDHYQKLTLTLDLEIAMGNLDYFLTTNLLFPGKHIFIADSPNPDAGYDHGLGVPRDVILTGQITESL